jgi:hypothetical protein
MRLRVEDFYMNAEQKLLLRQALLRQLAAAAPASLPPATLRHGAGLAGFRLSEDELRNELDYLAEKNLLQMTPAALSPGLPRARLTAAGRDYLEAEGFL